MKPAPVLLERETTLPVKKRIEFKIGDPRALMQVNARQYSDVTTAVIREYSTNAYDAHLMAGHSDPIDVSLPSALNPFFEVRDHGVGMDIDTFEQIYTQFGISNKRGDVKANGQLGIGSKSGLAYTTQFKVTSVKDGIKTVAKVIREPDWTLVMDVLTEELTDEPNGTVIRIPVHNVDEFKQKAHDFYKFWLPGRVLIDGEPSVHHVGKKIADNLYYSKDWMTSYVVMANVPYRINNPGALFREAKLSQLNFVAYVDELAEVNGSAPIEFTPSREDLEYSELTKSTLQNIILDFERDLLNTAQSEINTATDHAEAYTAWARWKETLSGNLFGDLEFKGEKFRSDYVVSGRKYNPRGGRYSVEAINKWSVESSHKTLFITDFNITLSSNSKSKAKAYIDLKHPDDGLTMILFLNGPRSSLDSVWVDWTKMHVVSWPDLKAALPKTTRDASSRNSDGYGRLPGSWDYWTGKFFMAEQEIPPDAKEIYWVSYSEDKYYHVGRILSLMGSDAIVLKVPANRLAKLKRNYPQIRQFIPAAQDKVVKDASLLLSADAKAYLNLREDWVNWANHLDLAKVDDPEFKKVRDLSRHKDTLLAEYNQNNTLAEFVGMRYNITRYNPEYGDWLTDKYPLLSRGGYLNIHEHTYLYLNAAHAAESEKN